MPSVKVPLSPPLNITAPHSDHQLYTFYIIMCVIIMILISFDLFIVVQTNNTDRCMVVAG